MKLHLHITVLSSLDTERQPEGEYNIYFKILISVRPAIQYYSHYLRAKHVKVVVVYYLHSADVEWFEVRSNGDEVVLWFDWQFIGQ